MAAGWAVGDLQLWKTEPQLQIVDVCTTVSVLVSEFYSPISQIHRHTFTDINPKAQSRGVTVVKHCQAFLRHTHWLTANVVQRADRHKGPTSADTGERDSQLVATAPRGR